MPVADVYRTKKMEGAAASLSYPGGNVDSIQITYIQTNRGHLLSVTTPPCAESDPKDFRLPFFNIRQ